MKSKCKNCNKTFKFGEKSVRLYYLGETSNFCSKDCYEKSFWKMYNKKGKYYFRKTYAWVINGVKKLISKKEAVDLYNSLTYDGFEVFFENVQKSYPELYRYRCEKGLSILMLNVALRSIGEIE